MPPVTRTATVDLDSWFYQEDGSGDTFGNGKGPRMNVGHSSFGALTGKHRFAVRIPRGTLFDGIPSAAAITAFALKVRVNSGCDDTGGSVRVFVERGVTTLSENSTTTNCGLTSSGSSNAAHWPGPDTDPANRGSYSGSPAVGNWIAINALDLGRWWYANPGTTALVLVAKAANAGLTDYDETTASRRMTIYSRHGSSAPYAELTFNDNQAPNAPTDPNPPAGSKVASTNGTSATVSSRHNDPEGDAATKYQAQWFPAGTTDAQADAGTVLPLSGQDNTVTATTAHNALRSHTFSGLPARTAGVWRMRFYDGQWGAWGLLSAAATAFKPTAINLAVQQGTLTPTLYASILSNDPGDFITAVEEFVYQDVAAGDTITKWAPGKQNIGGSPTRSEVTYGGSALVYGTPYRRRVVIYNRDDVPSDLTANFPFTQSEAVGPNVSPGDTLTKVNTLTPTVTLTDPGAANIDQARVEWLNEAGNVVLADSGVVSFTAAASRNVTAPAGIYDWGMLPQLRAYIRLSGSANMGPARTVTIRLNARPGSPYPVTISGGQTVQRADGVWVTTDNTPDALFPFRDTDLTLAAPDTISRQEVEVRTLADAHFGASPYIDATAPFNQTFTLPALTVETTYKTRARYDDAAAVRSDWSEYQSVKYSAAPTLSGVIPAASAVVTDPTPTFDWLMASGGSKPQAGWRLVVRDGDTDLYDSGLVTGTAHGVTLPPHLLPSGAGIDWTLTVYDTDGLAVTVVRSFTTTFTQPPALTGLTLTEDTDAKGLLAVWDVSALPANEFYAYIISARTEGGQFREVTRITDKATHAFLYRAAAHNRETIIRVTQDNGWLESDPIEASGQVVAEGYWIASASAIDELAHVTGHGGDTQTRLERLAPIGRPEELVLNWGTTGYVGTFAILSNDRDLLARLRAYKAAGEVVLFKMPYGDVRYAKLTGTPDDDGVAAWFSGSVGYVELTPESATF